MTCLLGMSLEESDQNGTLKTEHNYTVDGKTPDQGEHTVAIPFRDKVCKCARWDTATDGFELSDGFADQYA